MTAAVMTAGTLDGRKPSPGGREGLEYGLIGGVSPGPGAQGTKDGPLGVGPIPVLSEPLGSSISNHGSAGFTSCRPLAGGPFAGRCPQACGMVRSLCTDLPPGRTFWPAVRRLPTCHLGENQQATSQHADNGVAGHFRHRLGSGCVGQTSCWRSSLT